MKTTFTVLVVIMLAMSLAFVGCEGPEGPAGADGMDGIDGADGGAFCMTCHDVTVMDEKEAEFALAGHFEAYTRATSTSCAPCHSHEGFIMYGNGGQEPLEDAPAFGATMTCRTCHSHKTNGEGATFDTTAGVVPMRFDVDAVVMLTGADDMVMSNGNNMCVTCHQPRRAWTEYDDSEGDMVMVTSSHAGPHHSAQGAVLMGWGGNTNITPDAGPATHGTGAGCIECHLTDGNHDFKPVTTSCEECHTVTADFDYGDRRANVATKMATLEALLTEATGNAIERDTTGTYVVIPDSTVHGILHEEEGEFHPVVGQFDRAVYSAFWNYMIVMEDQSGGVHNPAYIEDMLDDAIAAME